MQESEANLLELLSNSSHGKLILFSFSQNKVLSDELRTDIIHFIIAHERDELTKGWDCRGKIKKFKYKIYNLVLFTFKV